MTVGATNEGMVAGDAVNTAARVQSAAAAGPGAGSTAATRRLGAGAIGFDDAGRARAEGQGRTGAALAGDPGPVRRSAGAQRVDGLEAPLDRAGRRDAHARANSSTRRPTGASHAWSWCPARPGSASRGWAGSSRSTSTGWSSTYWWHRGPVPVVRRGRVVLGARRDGRVSGSASPRTTRPRPRPPSCAQGLDALRARPRRARLRRHPAGPAARRAVRRRPGGELAAGGAVRRLAALLRAAGRRPTRWCCWSRTSSTPTRAARLPRPPGRLGARPADLRARASPAPSSSRCAPASAPGATGSLLTLDPLDEAVDAPRCVEALVPGMPRAPATRSSPGAGHPAVRGRDGALAHRPRHRAADRRGLPARRRRRRPRRAGQPARAARRAAGRARRRTYAAWWPTRPSSGTSFPEEALAARLRPRRRRPSQRRARPSCSAARSSPCRADPLSPERGSYRFAQDDAAPGRLRHPVAPGPQGPPPRGGGAPAGDVPQRRRGGRRRRRRGTTWTPLAAVPDDPDERRDPRGGRRGPHPGSRARRAARARRAGPRAATLGPQICSRSGDDRTPTSRDAAAGEGRPQSSHGRPATPTRSGLRSRRRSTGSSGLGDDRAVARTSDTRVRPVALRLGRLHRGSRRRCSECGRDAVATTPRSRPMLRP